jgi:hypothetical protein
MATNEPPRVFIESELLGQVMASDEDRDAERPAIVLKPKTPIGPPIRVLSFADMNNLEAEWIVTLSDLPAGPVAIEALPSAELSMSDLNDLATALDRDLIVRRVE